jgi:hypothetical protein
VNIPQRLEDWRFIKLQHHTKIPVDQDWPTTSNYAVSDAPLLAWIENGGNYGVLCGSGHIVIDADTKEMKQLVRKKLPKTFRVKTPHGGEHSYFNCDLDSAMRLRDKDGLNIGDIQGRGKQVVGPGCVVDERPYEVIEDVEIADITQDQLTEVFGDYIVKHDLEFSEEEQKLTKEAGVERDIVITDVVPVGKLRKQGDEYYGAHPLHGSDTGRNFWVNPAKNVWHCFRHSTGGGPLAWLAVEEGIISCEDAVKGALREEKFKRVLEKARARGYVPEKEGLLEKVEVTERIERMLENKEFFEKFVESVGATVKRDEPMKELLILTGISAYSEDPINVFLKGPTSTGKTFPAREVFEHFPERDVWYLAGLSPKALAHEFGEWDGEGHRFVVDLRYKILFFLEPPSFMTYMMLRPILSHDRYEFDYKFVDKTGKGQMRTQTVTLRGWPACVFCSSEVNYIEDLTTRGITHTPDITKEKWKDAIKRRALESSTPWLLGKEKIRRRDIRDSVKALKNRIIKERITRVIIPFSEELADRYEVTMARDMRDFTRLLSLIRQAALLHTCQRPYLTDGEEKWVLATERDFEIGMELFLTTAETTQLGIPSDVLRFYRDVLSKKDQWTYVEAQMAARSSMGIKTGGKRFKECYIYPLLETGLLVADKDSEDRRRTILQPVAEKAAETAKSKLTSFRSFFPKKKFENWLKNLRKKGPVGGSVTILDPMKGGKPLPVYISYMYSGKHKGSVSLPKQAQFLGSLIAVSKTISPQTAVSPTPDADFSKKQRTLDEKCVYCGAPAVIRSQKNGTPLCSECAERYGGDL